MHAPAPARRTTRLAAALVVAASLTSGLAAAPAQAEEPATRAVAASFDSQVIALVNAERDARGLEPLKGKKCVDRFAAKQAGRMAKQDRMFHQSLGPVMRKCRLRGAGENVAWRSPSMSAAQVVQMWMDSPGHRANILSSRYRFIGVDAVQHVRSGRVYAAQVFGS